MKRSTPLKRTGFKPKVSAKPGILRTATLPDLKKVRKTAIKRVRKAIPAHEKAHYKRVAALPCAECGIEGYSQCAHSNRAIDGKGMGLKAHYLNTFPLCCTRPGEYGCHAKHDRLIGVSKAEADERTVRYIAETHKKLGISNG